MKYEIKGGSTILFAAEAVSLRDAVEQACRSGANLYRADLSGADLYRANLYGADLSGANLYRADLSGANLSGANLSGADLSGANLYRADLSCAYLSCANLSGAYLPGANLYRAYLSCANLSGAYLSGANLSGAYLYGADLSGANLSCANLSGATGVDRYRTTPLLMLLDQPGKIRAYKLVAADGQSPIQSTGKITYTLGNTYEVPNANTDETAQCAAGINLATLPWCMSNWQNGWRILIAEFESSDIAAIPISTDGKFRVRKCTIVGEKSLVEIGLVKEPEAVSA